MVLSDGTILQEITTTVEESDPYDIQIQGSDRPYPAVILRRKHRGVGATIKTISKFGQHSSLYVDYEESVRVYVVRRKQRLDNSRDNSDNTDNSQNHRENPTTRDNSEGGITATPESWLTETFRSVVGGRDNSKGD